MQVCEHDLALEHCALMRDYGRAQLRCSEQMNAQVREIERLQAENLRLRARLVARETALAWAAQDHAAREQAAWSLPGRLALARRWDTLLALLRELLNEPVPAGQPAQHADAPVGTTPPSDEGAAWSAHDAQALEASLRAADLVICQTGCLGHGAFWRVQDHCRRTGKTCVLVAQPELLRLMQGRDQGAGMPAPQERKAQVTATAPASCTSCSAGGRPD